MNGSQFWEGCHKLSKVIGSCFISFFRGSSEGIIINVKYYWGEDFQAFSFAKSPERCLNTFERSFVFKTSKKVMDF